MRIISLILIILIVFSFSASAIGKDKLLHFSAGTLIYYYTDNYTDVNPMLAVSLAGVGKELYDSQTNGTIEIADVFATVLGGFVISFEW
jgi:hypothetical protein